MAIDLNFLRHLKTLEKEIMKNSVFYENIRVSYPSIRKIELKEAPPVQNQIVLKVSDQRKKKGGITARQ